jgi:hypothetical protein
MTMNVKEINKLGREEIIKMAVEKLNQIFSQAGVIDFNPINFDCIRVMVADDSVSVTFGMTYRYIPLNSAYYYGVFIDLIENVISYNSLTNPQDHDYNGKPKFFCPNEISEKTIAFVIDAINKCDDIESIIDGQLPDDTTMAIYEKPDHYEIEVNSGIIISNFKVDIESGKVYDTTHEHIEPEPF